MEATHSKHRFGGLAGRIAAIMGLFAGLVTGIVGTATSPARAASGASITVAFQANTNHLWIRNAAGSFDTGYPMAPYTSPSIATEIYSDFGLSLSRSHQLVAFQGSDYNLWYYDPTSYYGWDTFRPMAPHTSPSIAGVEWGYEVAYQDNSNFLEVTGDAADYNTWLGMAPYTSPSIDGVHTSFEVAFQANTGKLWLTGPFGTYNTGLGMGQFTSPSIEGVIGGCQACGKNPFWVYFQANTGKLHFDDFSTGRAGTIGLGMAPFTSPSMNYIGFGAFQANTGYLEDTCGSPTAHNRWLGMMQYTSPSVTSWNSPAGSYGAVEAFQANTSYLYIVDLTNGYSYNTWLGMAPYTSPSIASPSEQDIRGPVPYPDCYAGVSGFGPPDEPLP